MGIFRSLLRSERGIGMLEMLIATFLTMVTGAAAMEFYISQHKAWLVENEVAEIQQNARAVIDEIASRLRMGGYQLTSGHPAYLIGSDSLAVYYHDDVNGDIDTLTFYVDATNPSKPQLKRHLSGELAATMAENVEDLTVTVISARILQVDLTARAAETDSTLIHGDGYRRRTFSTQIRLRNS